MYIDTHVKFDGLTSDYLINASPLFYVYLSHFLLICYIIVLHQNPFVSPL